MCLKTYGCGLGSLLLIYAGIHSFSMSFILLYQCIKTKTFDYFEMIEKSVGKKIKFLAWIFISLDYLAC